MTLQNSQENKIRYRQEKMGKKRNAIQGNDGAILVWPANIW